MAGLFITDNAPFDGGSGGQIASWRLLRAYASLADMDVLALVPPGRVESADLRSLARRTSLVTVPHFYAARSPLRSTALLLRSQLGGPPFRVAKFRSREAESVLRDWAETKRYDFVHYNGIAFAEYASIFPHSPAVLGTHCVEYETFERLAGQRRNALARAILRRESDRVGDWEARALGRFVHTFVLSESDRRLLVARRSDLRARISMWPVPVESRPARRPRSKAPFTVMALGSLDAPGRCHGLRWFLEEVWATFRERNQDARLKVIGAHPRRDISAHNGHEGVTVYGFLERLEPELADVDLCIIPLFSGTGIRIKVLEMISRGIPCLGTQPAFQGLPAVPGCLRADTADEWVDALVAAAADPDLLASAASRGARELTELHAKEAATAHLREVMSKVGVAPGWARKIEMPSARDASGGTKRGKRGANTAVRAEARGPWGATRPPR